MVHKKQIPLFDGSNYGLWKVRMEAFLIALGYEVWKSVNSNYTVPQNGISTQDDIRATEIDGKAKHALLSRLTNSELVKVVNLKIANAISKKLESVYEGDDKVKQAKIQNLKLTFETM